MNEKSHVQLFSSIYGKRSPRQYIYEKDFVKPIEYSASKAATVGMLNHLAVTMANDRKGRINSISLGGVESKNHTNEFKQKYLENVPLKRFCKIIDILNICNFLSSDKAAYITGANIDLWILAGKLFSEDKPVNIVFWMQVDPVPEESIIYKLRSV